MAAIIPRACAGVPSDRHGPPGGLRLRQHGGNSDGFNGTAASACTHGSRIGARWAVRPAWSAMALGAAAWGAIGHRSSLGAALAGVLPRSAAMEAEIELVSQHTMCN